MTQFHRLSYALAGLVLLASPDKTLAQSAPLPKGQAAEPQPVIACTALGSGFFNIPGTSTCLRMGIDVFPEIRGDFVHKDFNLVTTRIPNPPGADVPVMFYQATDQSLNADRYAQRPNGRVTFTTVTLTDGRPVISYVALRSGFNDNAADIRTRTGGANTGIGLEQGWVSASGVTVGLRNSIFDFSSGYTYSGGYASQRILNQIAYEHPLSDKASLSVALEDNAARRYEDYNNVWADYGGQRAPDVVLRGRFDDNWGAAHLAGALHPIHDALTDRSTIGWAINAGLEYKQDWSQVFGDGAKGMYGRVLLTGAYSDGALDYLGIPRFSTDYVADADGGTLVPTKGFSGLVSYEHLWSTNFKTTATLGLYRTQATLKDFDWMVQGGVAQVGAKYNPLPGTYIGGELSWFFDKVQGTYFEVPGAETPVSYLQAMLYPRRSL